MELIGSLIHHIRFHVRFYGAALLGLIGYFALPLLVGPRAEPFRTTVGGDILFGAYLTAMALLLSRATSSDIRERARDEDETTPYIFVLTAIAMGVSLIDIFTLLHTRSLPLSVRVGLGIFSLVLAWSALHVAAGFHYAHLFYSEAEFGGDSTHSEWQSEGPDARGLLFPGTQMPLLWDFLYFSFVIGMTAQVSDVQVSGGRMRKLVLLHGVASFFFNTIILALAVNAAAGLSS